MLEAPDECLSIPTRSRCTALVVQPVYKQIQTFLLGLEGVSILKATPVPELAIDDVMNPANHTKVDKQQGSRHLP